jgi:hypothetical protein
MLAMCARRGIAVIPLGLLCNISWVHLSLLCDDFCIHVGGGWRVAGTVRKAVARYRRRVQNVREYVCITFVINSLCSPLFTRDVSARV